MASEEAITITFAFHLSKKYFQSIRRIGSTTKKVGNIMLSTISCKINTKKN
jgi:hypothetical protein